MATELTESLLHPKKQPNLITRSNFDGEKKSTVELTEINQRTITINSVKQKHEQLMDNNQSIDTAIPKLVNILGGIDIILRQQLSPPNCSRLTENELRQINDVLLSFDNDLDAWNDAETATLVQMVNERNTFLHRVCCRKCKKVADELMKYLFGKFTSWFWGLLMMTLIVSTIIDYFTGSEIEHNVVTLFKNLFIVTLTLPFCIIWVLSLNITITKKIMKQFEFWFKLFYFLRYWICSSFICYKGRTALQIGGNMMVDITLFLLYIIYCFMDGFKLSSTFKAFVLVTGSIYMTVVAIYWSFLDDTMYGTSSVYVWKVDFKTLTASSLRTVVVFMWKQTIYSWYKPGAFTYGPVDIAYSRRYTAQ